MKGMLMRRVGGRLPVAPLVDVSLNYGRETVRELAAIVGDARVVLDVGAGGGTDLAAIQKIMPNAEMHGVDLDGSRLKAAGFEAHALDLERDKLPFDDESVDLIVSNQVMEHLKEVFWVLHEMTRCLAVGGHLLIGVPNLASFHNRLLLLVGRQPTSLNNSSAHLRGYTKRDLLGLLDSGFEGGYRCEALRGSNFYPLPHGPAVWMARRFPTGAWSIFLLLRKTSLYEGGYLQWPVTGWLETNFRLSTD